MSYQPGQQDGDAAAKTFDKGVAATAPHTDLSDGVFEAAKPHSGSNPIGEKTTGAGISAFDKDGAIGSQFKADGAIGQIGEAVGGAFSSAGAIGSKFTEKGSIGGSVQEHLGGSASK